MNICTSQNKIWPTKFHMKNYSPEKDKAHILLIKLKYEKPYITKKELAKRVGSKTKIYEYEIKSELQH